MPSRSATWRACCSTVRSACDRARYGWWASGCPGWSSISSSAWGCDGRRSGGDDAPLFQVLVRRAVLAIGQRRALARLALARGCLAAGDTLTATLDLLQDVRHGLGDVAVDRVVDPRLVRDREEVPDLVEQALAGLREVVGI